VAAVLDNLTGQRKQFWKGTIQGVFGQIWFPSIQLFKRRKFPKISIFLQIRSLKLLGYRQKNRKTILEEDHPREIKPKFDPIRSIWFLRIRPTCEKLMDGGRLTTVDRHRTPSDGKSSLTLACCNKKCDLIVKK